MMKRGEWESGRVGEWERVRLAWSQRRRRRVKGEVMG
jgi:hypothetical protein